MTTILITKSISQDIASKNFEGDEFEFYIKHSDFLNPVYISYETQDDILDLEFTRTLDVNETNELTEILGLIGFNDPLKELKIYRYINDLSSNHDPRLPPLGHNYKTGLTTRLHHRRTMVKGEVQLVEYFADEALTDMVLDVHISYVRDGMGLATSRTTIREWYMENGVGHKIKKITNKIYTTNTEDQINEGRKRRTNIVTSIQMPTLNFMMEHFLPQGKTQTEVLLMGRDFMDRHEVYFKNFIENSSSITDPNSPDYGLKTIVVKLREASTSTDTWLTATPPSLGGTMTILAYLQDQFTI